MQLDIHEIDDKKLGKCVYISNNTLELVVTIDSGPRIVHFGLKGLNNIFMQKYSGNLEDTGHSIWFNRRTINKDFNVLPNSVTYTILPDRIKFHAVDYIKDMINLDLDIIIVPDANDVMLIHSVQNMSKSKKVLSLFTNTSLKIGGTIIVPQNTDDTAYFPNRTISFWPNSDLSNSNFCLGNDFITLKTKKQNEYFKFGINNRSSSAIYTLSNLTFIKRYLHNLNAQYPDFGTSFCACAKSDNILMQINSPFYITEHKEIFNHVENWSVYNTPLKLEDINKESLNEFLNQL